MRFSSTARATTRFSMLVAITRLLSVPEKCAGDFCVEKKKERYERRYVKKKKKAGPLDTQMKSRAPDAKTLLMDRGTKEGEVGERGREKDEKKMKKTSQ